MTVTIRDTVGKEAVKEDVGVQKERDGVHFVNVLRMRGSREFVIAAVVDAVISAADLLEVIEVARVVESEAGSGGVRMAVADHVPEGN